MKSGIPKNGHESGIETQYERYVRLFNEVTEFIYNRYEADVQEYFDSEWAFVTGDDPDDPTVEGFMVNFHEWLIHAPDLFEEEVTGIEIYMEDADNLSPEDEAVLLIMNESVMSLFEFHVSGDRNSVEFRDIILGGTYRENEAPVPPDMKRGLVAGRRMILDGNLCMGAGFYPFDPDYQDDILAQVREEFESERLETPDLTMEEFLKESEPLLAIWLEGFDLEEDDLPPVSYTALFEILDEQKLPDRLRTIPSLHREEDFYIWVEDFDGPEPEGRGVVTVLNGTLTLGSYSPELLEAGKIMLLSVCSGLIRHIKDVELGPEDPFDDHTEEN